MSRSSKKGPYVDMKLLKKVNKLNETNEKKVIKSWARACVIVPEMVGHTVAMHDGRRHLPIFVTESMVGHRFGEFVPTRIFRGHGGKQGRKTVLKK